MSSLYNRAFWRWVFGAFAVSIILVVGYFFPDSFSWMEENITKINVIGNLVLTGLLVYLYDQQRKLLSLNQTARVEPIRYSSDGDELEVELSNFGDGAAHDLELITLIRFPPSRWSALEISSGIAETQLYRSDGSPGLGNSLQGGQEGVQFKAEPVTAVSEGNWRMNRLLLGLALERLKSSKAESASLHFSVRYADALGNQNIEQFLHLEADLEELPSLDIDFEDFHENAENLAEKPDNEVVLPEVWADLSFDLGRDELRQW
ncbi:hypothetical protein [Haloarchaeobius sp. DT45]|uniref:hypothetical protein n=1 Tax=Haloarchaeobius sp. DT45 TaxID=3446116 RepID=UPI003F6D95CA